MSNSTTNMNFPFFLRQSETDNVAKEASDKYDVFVNKDFVGNKVLVTQTEDIGDLKGYLEKKGFQGLDTTLDGDHYIIQTENMEQAEQLKDMLSLYLDLR